MLPFTFSSPTKIVFGADTAAGVADYISAYGVSKVLLVTDEGIIRHGVINPILESFKAAGMPSPLIFDAVPPDSDLNCVRRAVDLAKADGIELVLALGGGSVIDTAKVASIGLSFEGDLLDYEGMNVLPGRVMPIVAIPTTAGTGSEVSAVAMIKDTVNECKLTFGSRFLYPELAILDPMLIVSLPPKLTAATGMDVLTHALESVVAATSNSTSDALALEAMQLCFRYLPRATAHGDDLEARSAMLVASTMAGMAFTNAGVGIVHALAHTIGAHCGTHHGLTNSIFLPGGISFNRDVRQNRYSRCWRNLAAYDRQKPITVGDLKFLPEEDDSRACDKLIEAVKHLAIVCKLPTTLSAAGVEGLSDEQIASLALQAQTDPAIMFNPREASVEDLEELIRGVL